MSSRFGFHNRGRRRRLVTALAMLAVAAIGSTAYAAESGSLWLTGGQNSDNSRNQATESKIGAGNVSTLAPKADFASSGAFLTGSDTTTGGDVSATPAVDGQRVYFPDSKGHLFAIDRSTGATVWTASISALTGIPGDYARATPAIAGDVLIIGDQGGKFELPDWTTTHPSLVGAWVLGLDRKTGALLWKTRVHDHFTAIVTTSAQVHGDTAFVGVASNEEAFSNVIFAGGRTYACCSFRGRVVSLDVRTGAINWATYTVPATAGYSGGAVWGSTPAFDPSRGALYVGTGNNYSLPADRTACVQAAATFAAKQACLPGDNFDAIMSLDAGTGAVNWSFRALPSDAWNVDCGIPGFGLPGTTNSPSNCPAGQGPDYDFGQAPLLLTVKRNGKPTDIVGAGAKSGVFTALNRSTGAVLWQTQVGPGGLTGGLQWGSATDGKRIYAAESNSDNIDPSTNAYSPLARGWWSALDPATGAILWRTGDPGAGLLSTWGVYGYSAQGPVSTANGVVYGCSLSPNGPNMVAMDAATGAIKWSFASGTSCIGGAAIANGTVYWGTGYRSFAPATTAGNKLYAFTPGGN